MFNMPELKYAFVNPNKAERFIDAMKDCLLHPASSWHLWQLRLAAYELCDKNE